MVVTDSRGTDICTSSEMLVFKVGSSTLCFQEVHLYPHSKWLAVNGCQASVVFKLN